ncbi:hypothetical protein GIB67_008817 [Kingdonia uniflora]|uniref:Aminotransferase-like plant mobile domain-containing protein n=1 Tax=Kingdonia uniflora TaxID=39325 RepID=A0A7J7LV27_9MAGN|nr:hypothetical protein GIB67_008817 [Kingdonia uniflora]
MSNPKIYQAQPKITSRGGVLPNSQTESATSITWERNSRASGTVPLGYLATVNDLDSAAQYDWGSAILASLYHGLDTAVTTRGAITRFVQLLPYWFYEYCGVGHPIVKEEVKYPAYLRLRAWEIRNRKKTNDQVANLFIIGRYHIHHRTVEKIIWKPWFDSAVSETKNVLNAKLLSRKRIPLQVPNGNYEYYLGDRCWRQVAGEERETYAPYWAEQTSEDLQLRRGCDVRVVSLSPGGGMRTRQRGSGPRTRGGNTCRRGRGTGDDSE